MLYLKALHIITAITWFAGIFYLPRLFVYHAMAEDKISIERFKIMERKLFYGIMTPSAILTVGLGLWILHAYAWELYGKSAWLHIKLTSIFLLCIYHLYCWHLMIKFKYDKNRYSHIFYRILNEVPVVLLLLIIFMAVLKI